MEANYPLKNAIKQFDQQLKYDYIHKTSLGHKHFDEGEADIDQFHGIVKCYLKNPSAEINIGQIMKNLLKVFMAQNEQHAAYLIGKIYCVGVQGLVGQNRNKGAAWIEAAIKISEKDCKCPGQHINLCMLPYYKKKLNKQQKFIDQA